MAKGKAVVARGAAVHVQVTPQTSPQEPETSLAAVEAMPLQSPAVVSHLQKVSKL